MADEPVVYLDAKKFRAELKKLANDTTEPNQPTVRLAINLIKEAVEATVAAQEAEAPPPVVMSAAELDGYRGPRI